MTPTGKAIIVLGCAFGLGVYVGRPSQVVVNVPDIQVKCRPGHTEPTASKLMPVAVVPTPAVAPSPSPTPSTLPAEAPLAKAEEPKTEQKTITNDDRDSQQTCDDWVKDKVKEAAKWIAKYEQRDCKITVTHDEASCLPQLRPALDAANLRIIEEGPVTVGDYAYYFVVNAK